MVVEVPVAQVFALHATAAHKLIVALNRSLQAPQELTALVLILGQLAGRVAVHMRLRELLAICPATHARMRQWNALWPLETHEVSIWQSGRARCSIFCGGIQLPARDPTAAEAPQPGKVSLTVLRPLLLSALSAGWGLYGKLRAGLGLRGSPAAGRRPVLGHGRAGRQGGCSAPPSPPANSQRALPSAPLHVPHTGRCTTPLATSSSKGSARH